MKYVFPCIINKTQDLYSLSFPDLENRKIFGTDLYDILRMAHNVLLIDLYVKEAQRMVIADPTPFEKLNIENGQIVSYITCDTDMLSNMLDLYDNIQTNDLEKFLQEKSEESEAYETTISAETLNIDKDEKDEEADKPVQEDDITEELLDFEDDLEVVSPQSPEESDTNDASANNDVNKEADASDETPKPQPQRQKPKRRYNNYRPPKKNS